MKKILTLSLLCGSSLAQNLSPQPNFSTQINLASPSLWTNFNDSTSAFKDQVSGLTFAGQGTGATPIGTLPTVAGDFGGGAVEVVSAPMTPEV
jgi:hypothetical protein